MIRRDREITDEREIEAIIRKATICRLALSDNGIPYVVPLNFGYKDKSIYFHSAPKGKKLDIIRRNNEVCFELDVDHELVRADVPCKWGMKYRSVIGFGKAFLVEDFEEKIMALNTIMQHYWDNSHEFPETRVDEVAIIRVDIRSMTGKQSGY